MSKIARTWLLIHLFILLCGGSISYGQQTMKMFAARTFYEDNGLISSQINTAAQSSSGLMWFATPKGISTFDGIRWKQVKGSETFPAHTKSMLVALPGDSMLQMGFSPDTKLTLQFYHQQLFVDLVPPQHPPKSAWQSQSFNGAVLKEGKNLTVAVQMQEEIWLLQLPQKRWQQVKLPQELDPLDVTKLLYFQQDLLILSTKGLYSYQPSSKEFRQLWPSLLQGKTLVGATPAADGSSLYLLGTDWLAEWKDNRLQVLQEGFTKHGTEYSPNAQYDIVATQTGLLIFQLEGSLFVLNPKTGFLEPFRLNDTFSTATPTHILEDQEGNLWFSTHRGVAMLNSLSFATMDKFMLLPDNEISTIFEIDSSTLLLGSNLGVNILENYRWVKKASGDLIFDDSKNRIMDVARLNDRQLLVAGNSQGLGILNQHDYQIRWHSLPGARAISSVASWKGKILVGTEEGKLLTFEKESFQPFLELPPNIYIRKITTDKANRILVLTTQGIFRYDGTTLQQLRADSPQNNNIYSLLEWNDRTILGTSKGLAVLLGDKIVPLNDSITVERPVFALLLDKQHQLWMGTDKGLFVYKNGNTTLYSRYNGLAGREVNRHALVEMKDGRIWIGTDKGLSIYDPAYDYQRTIVPRVQISEIRSNDDLLKADGDYYIENEDNTLEFSFQALSFYFPEGLEYRYRLQGFEKYWVLSDNYLQHSVRYTNLPAGKYTFVLQARVQNGPWSPEATSEEITIAPPYYATWWFIAVAALALTFVGYATRSFVSFKSNERRLKAAMLEKINQIEQSESKFEAIWESMDTSVAIINRKGSIIMANPAFLRLFPQHQEPVIGKDITSLLQHSRFTHSYFQEWYKSPVTSRFEMEIQKEGLPLYLLVTFTSLNKLMPNEPLLMIGMKNISDQKEAEMKNLRLNELLVRQNRDLVKKELELASFNFELLKRQEELQGALKVLEERNFELDQFVYKTSHDLRAPIASSLGLLNIMKMEGMSNSWPSYVDMIMKSLQKQDSFIKAMLNFSKTARADEKPELIDFEVLVDQCLTDLQYLPGYEKINKQVLVRALNGGFYSDKMKINIILSNVLSNSIKYRDNSKDSHLDITINTDHSHAQILISDNGIGINKSYLDHIFEMFYRATERSDGSGLGLYIVKQTVERLGGKIEVSSELGVGSSFKIVIPNLIKKAEEAEQAFSQQEPDEAAALS